MYHKLTTNLALQVSASMILIINQMHLCYYHVHYLKNKDN